MTKAFAILALVGLTACARQGGPEGADATAGQSPEVVLAQIIEGKGCQLGPVRAEQAREEMGLDQAAFDALVQSMVDAGRVSVHTDGQIELMSEICI